MNYFVTWESEWSFQTLANKAEEHEESSKAKSAEVLCFRKSWRLLRSVVTTEQIDLTTRALKHELHLA